VPYERRRDFPKVAQTSESYKRQMMEKYPEVFGALLGRE
jgi:hypothetical protein